jgi:hypothetical protein
MLCIFMLRIIFLAYVFLLLPMLRSVYSVSLCCSVYCLCVVWIQFRICGNDVAKEPACVRNNSIPLQCLESRVFFATSQKSEASY